MSKSKGLLDSLSNEYKSITDKIINKIKISKKIAVYGHVEPDGDSVGAQLALKEALNENGWNVSAVSKGPFDSMVLRRNKKYFTRNSFEEYDLYIIVDTPDIERISGLNDDNNFCKNNCIVIDHHFTNSFFGHINWVDDSFISTSEMIFLLLFRMGIGLDNENVRQFLLNGIISDSGFFSHIRKEKYFSLLASYYLIDKGADPKLSYHIMFGGKELAAKKLLAVVLERIESCLKGEILWTYISEKDRKKFKNSYVDSFDIFKQMMTIGGVEIAILFKIKKKKIDVSFRSNDKVDVASFAKSLGGGGHKAAAGVSLIGDFEEIKKNVLDKVKKFFKDKLD